ncbi:MAG TPA: SAM-dependent methyltransferase [Streptosporangiaceae bacterium]|nr:SAM-dependent methyltransferase [Streptosporangiaceae bacterium]
MTYEGDWREAFRPDIPSVARIYDYLLGGKDNYEVDRAVGESMIAQLPNVQVAVQWNRAFLRRVVRYLVQEAGIRQIIDVGAGLPSAGNTHEVALDACPQTRVVYVDHDPVVLAHARDMLHSVPSSAIIGRDMLEPDTILADPVLRNLIDFGEPVALLFLSILHFVSSESDPAGLIARLLAPFPAGSFVAISHATPDTVPEVNDVERIFDESTTPAHVRTRAQVSQLVAEMEIIEPGLTWPPLWRPDPGDELPVNPEESYYCVIVARTT